MVTANKIITLTTDFGITDAYVGEMKGSMLKQAQDLIIIDLTHYIKPHDINKAATTIFSSYSHFPSGTTHLIVVDPGVGSDRSLLVIKADNHYFLAPDNGILTLFFQDHQVQDIHRIETKNLSLKNISSTFHGRDILAPVAAKIASGFDFSKLGPKIPMSSCVHLPRNNIKMSPHNIEGNVTHIDHFGNIQTDIPVSLFDNSKQDRFKNMKLNNCTINNWCTIYSQVQPGSLLALVDSAGYVEIAINQGNAAEYASCKLNDKVCIFLN